MNTKDRNFFDNSKARVKNAKEDVIAINGVELNNAVDKLKFSLCQQFINYRKADLPNRKAKDLAEVIGANPSQVSEIFACKTDRFTIDFLVNKLEQLATHDEGIQRVLTRLLLTG